MKKLILLVLIAAVTLSPLANAAIPSTVFSTPKTTAAATHTVFIEEGTATWCGYCPTAAEALMTMYDNEQNHSFYFAADVYDQSQVAKDRFIHAYGGRAFPSIFLDGDFSHMVGVGTNVAQTMTSYQDLIDAAAARDVRPMTLATTVTGHNNGKYDISVKVTNTGSKLYIGILKTFVTEKVSRWKNAAHVAYHFATLDIIKKFVMLKPQASKDLTFTFDGAAKHGNLTFTDLQDTNIKVISTIAYLQIHKVPAEQYIKAHNTIYIDQTDAADVTE